MAASKKAVRNLLIRARKRIEKRENWVQRASKKFVYPSRGRAGVWAFCATGSVREDDKTGGDTQSRAYRTLWASLPEWHRKHGLSVEEFNDAKSRKHKDILDLFDRAIEMVS